MIHRNEVYACKIHSRQLKRGDKKYQNIKETIQINLNNFRCNEKDIKEEYYMRSKEGRYLTKKLRIDMVDMELGRKNFILLVKQHYRNSVSHLQQKI